MPLTVDIVGTGNVAFHFAKAIKKSKHDLRLIHSREVNKGEKFKLATGVSAQISCDKSGALEGEIGLLCVPDAAIEDVLRTYQFSPDTTVVHCSGATDLLPFKSVPNVHFGVMYPYQTMTQSVELDMSKVPLFIEASTDKSMRDIMELADGISHHVRTVDSESRLKLHLAAVFATNFSNAMYKVATDLLEEAGEEFGTIRHLIEEASKKALAVGPDLAQTGPALRGDVKTIEKHLNSLTDPSLKAIYQLISERISQASAHKS